MEAHIQSHKKANPDLEKTNVKTNEANECENCGEMFRYAYQLKRHYVKYHSTDEKYNCPVDNCVFRDLGHYMIMHMEKHEDRMVFCEVCVKSFKTEKLLEAHKENCQKSKQ